jgi:hypothetical protein
LLAAGAMTLGIAAPEAIGDGGAKTRIAIKKLTPGGASGTLSSSKEACLGDRKVSLFRLDDFVSVKIEITQSNGKGEWKTNKNLKEGQYFAKVDAVKGCRYDVSSKKSL